MSADRLRAVLEAYDMDDRAELLAFAVSHLLDEDSRKAFVEALDSTAAGELFVQLAEQSAE